MNNNNINKLLKIARNSNSLSSDILSDNIEELLKNEPLNEQITLEIILNELSIIINKLKKENKEVKIYIIDIGEITSSLINEIQCLLSIKKSQIKIVAKNYNNKTFHGILINSNETITIDDIIISTNPNNTIGLYHSKHQIVFNDLFYNEYFKQLEQHQKNLALILDTYTTNLEKTVFFIAKKVYFNQIRMSKALMDSGWKCIAIVFDSNMIPHQKKFFDKVVYTDFISFLLFIHFSKKRMLLHTQGWLFRYYYPVLIDLFKHKKITQVVEIMDSQSNFISQNALKHHLDSMKLAWGKNVKKNHELQLKCERYLINHSRGIVYNGIKDFSLESSNQSNKNNMHITFLSYPLKQFFSSSQKIPQEKLRMAFIGGVPTFTRNRPHEFFADAQLLVPLKKLLDIGCFIDVYNNPLIASKDDYSQLYQPLLKLMKNNPHFKFIYGSMPWDISEQINNYDIGLMLYDFENCAVGSAHFEQIIPTKLFTYLEAGLPVLVSTRLKATCQLVNRYKIGLCISDQQLENIQEILSAVDIQQLKKNVLEAREKIQMHHKIKNLINFYNSVLKDKQ